MSSPELLAALISEAGPRGTVVLTGAGISVPSGIPDFRSPGTGIWANVDPTTVATIGVFRSNPERFWSFYRQRLDICEGLEPNPAHDAVAELERRGLLGGLITQNIDGLHQKAGNSDVIEVHGSVRTLSCLRCDARFTREQALAELFDSADGVPYCPDCDHGGGNPYPLKPDVVLFGELLPEGAMGAATRMIGECRLLVCIGSSLVVNPVASLPQLVLGTFGAPLAIVTGGWTPYDPHATLKLSGDVAEEMAAAIAALEPSS